MKKRLYSFAVAATSAFVAALALSTSTDAGPGLRVHAASRFVPRPVRVPVAASVRAPVTAYGAPGGKALTRLGSRTAFGSPRVMPVASRRGRWLRVLADVSGRRSAWIRSSSAVFFKPRPVRLLADRSSRTLAVIERGRTLRRLPVAMGGPGSPTPVGRFGVTDRLSGAPYGGVYGCCVLALSGRQRHLPPGWTQGDRLAIHATERPHPTEGGSAGCVVASDDSLRYLMRRVPVGTEVTIRR